MPLLNIGMEKAKNLVPNFVHNSIPVRVTPVMAEDGQVSAGWRRFFGCLSMSVLLASALFVTVLVLALLPWHGGRHPHDEREAAEDRRGGWHVQADDDAHFRWLHRVFKEPPRYNEYGFRVIEDGGEGEARANIDTVKHVAEVMVPKIGEAEATDNFHDFNTDFTAMKVPAVRKCFIQRLNVTQYKPVGIHVASEPTTGRVVRAMQAAKSVVQSIIHPEVLRFTAGHEVANFCEGHDAHWLVDPAEHERAKRQLCHKMQISGCIPNVDICIEYTMISDCPQLNTPRPNTAPPVAPAPAADSPAVAN